MTSIFRSIRTGRKKTTHRILRYALVFGGAWIAVGWLMATSLIVDRPLEKADAILVLSGSVDYLERTEEAARLFEEGAAPKILLTNDGLRGGWNREQQRNPYFSERAFWELTRRGVPGEAIEILPAEVHGTMDEAQLFFAAAAERKIESVLLVTSPSHTRRTLWTFEKVAAAQRQSAINIGIASPRRGYRSSWALTWWLSPRGWETVALEYVKMIYYLIYY